MFVSRLAAVISLSLLLPTGAAFADTVKCQAKVAKATSQMHSKMVKGLDKCASAVRKARTKSSGVEPKTADACEKNLFKVFNIGGDAGKGVVAKILKSVNKLFTPGREVCTSADLSALGLLESGVNAPGVDPQDFLASALIMSAVDRAASEVNATSHDFQELLNDVLAITDCEGGERPNLCTYDAAQNPDCRTHACRLSASSSLFLHTDSVPASLEDRIATLRICRAPATLLGLPVDLSDGYRSIEVATSRVTVPAPTVAGLGVTVCMDTISGQGWCDCAGGSIPFEPTSCRDHILNDNAGICSGAGNFCLTEEDCGKKETCSSDGVDDCAVDLAEAEAEAACVLAGTESDSCFLGGGDCINAQTGARCHPGVYRGPETTSWAGSSAAGDCVLSQRVSFKFLPPAICITGGGLPLGTCGVACDPNDPNGICAADGQCSALGGANCQSPNGPDGQPCTRDDLIEPGPTQQLLFTTGSPDATLLDLVRSNGEGVCNGSSDNAGMNCVAQEDCPNGDCSGEVVFHSVSPVTQANPTGGNPLACEIYDTSSLSGLKLVAAFPIVDAVDMGDQAASISLDCE